MPGDVAAGLRNDLREAKRDYLVLEQLSVTSSTGVRRDIACAVPLSPSGTQALFAAVKRVQQTMPLGSSVGAAVQTSVGRASVDRSSARVVARSKAADFLLSKFPRSDAQKSTVASGRVVRPSPPVADGFHLSVRPSIGTERWRPRRRCWPKRRLRW